MSLPSYADNYTENRLTDHDAHIMVDLQLTQRFNKQISLHNIKQHVPNFEGTTYDLNQDSINKITKLLTEPQTSALTRNHLEVHCEDLGYEDAFEPIYVTEPEKQSPQYNIQNLIRNYFGVVGKETPSKKISKEVYKLVSNGKMGSVINGWQAISDSKFNVWADHILRISKEDSSNFFFNEKQMKLQISKRTYEIEEQKKLAKSLATRNSRYRYPSLSKSEINDIIEKELVRARFRMEKVYCFFERHFGELSFGEIHKKLNRYVSSMALIQSESADDVFCENISGERGDHVYLPLPINSVGLVAVQVYLDLKYDNLSVFSHYRDYDIFQLIGLN